MNQCGILAKLLSALFVAGLGSLLFSLAQSMRPTITADAALPRIDLSHLQPGEAKIAVDAMSPAWGAFSHGIVFVRAEDHSTRAWHVLLRAGHVAMPDIHWWRPLHECKDFGLAGFPDAALTCKDPDVPDWWKARWRGSVDGKAMHGMVDDMEPATGSFDGGFFVVGKRD